MALRQVEQWVLVALLTHDLCWITKRPEGGIPAMCTGFVLQTILLIGSCKIGVVEFVNDFSLLLWLAGNIVWTVSEYMWDDPEPAGFLAYVGPCRNVNKDWYPFFMKIALCLQIVTLLVLASFYVLWTFAGVWRRQRRNRLTIVSNDSTAAAAAAPTIASITPMASSAAAALYGGGSSVQTAPASAHVRRDAAAAVPLLSAAGPSENDHETAAEEAKEPYAFCPGLPLRVYYELFNLPWIAMDTGWEFSNYQDANKNKGVSTFALSSCGCIGFLAFVLTIDCVRRQLRDGQRYQACLSMCELCWVSGNVLWMLHDLLLHWMWMHCAAIGLFAAGPGFAFVATFYRGDAEAAEALEPEAHCEEFAVDVETALRMEEGGACSAAAAGCREASAATSATIASAAARSLAASPCRTLRDPPSPCQSPPWAPLASLPPPPLPPMSVPRPIVVSDKKAKGSRRRSKRHNPLGRGVAVLPLEKEEGDGSSCDVVKIAASLALKEVANHTEGSIGLIDLGWISAALVDWRAHMPRVSPYHVTRHLKDKKVLRLLRNAGCAFQCATAAEVTLVLSLGVPPRDVIFASPHKLRSHLVHARDAGVRWLPFDSEADLRKIAAEHPGAQLLLRTAARAPPLAPKETAVAAAATGFISLQQQQEEGGGAGGAAAAVATRALAAGGPPPLVTGGAARDEWQSLLALATQLGLKVAGVSLNTGLGAAASATPSPYPSCGKADATSRGAPAALAAPPLPTLEACLKDAREVFALAARLGMAPLSVLDLGTVDAGPAGSFAGLAAGVEALLSRFFPEEEFLGLRIAAEPGRLLSRGAVALVTQVVAKEPWPLEGAGAGSVASAGGVRYLLNDGLYGSFGCALHESMKVMPERLGIDGEVMPGAFASDAAFVGAGADAGDGGCPPPGLRPSSFVGPGRDAFDVILAEVMMPELEVGERLLWRASAQALAARASAAEEAPSGHLVDVVSAAKVWHYRRAADAL